VIAYLDSSVLLRVVLDQANALKEWNIIKQGVPSALVEVECLRTLDLLRLTQSVAGEAIAERREAVYRLLEAIDIAEKTYPVLSRAANRFRRRSVRWMRFIWKPHCCGKSRPERTCRWRRTMAHWLLPRGPTAST
jgi:hypothetical protein